MGQYPMVTFSCVEIFWAKSGPEMGQIWAKKQNAHMKWAFATSLDGLDVGCAGKI